VSRPRCLTLADQARVARAVVECALDGLGQPWPWHPGASRLIDLWLAVEDAA
jgi:hypothetical protein